MHIYSRCDKTADSKVDVKTRRFSNNSSEIVCALSKYSQLTRSDFIRKQYVPLYANVFELFCWSDFIRKKAISFFFWGIVRKQAMPGPLT